VNQTAAKALIKRKGLWLNPFFDQHKKVPFIVKKEKQSKERERKKEEALISDAE
jgi:hypothetical protein